MYYQSYEDYMRQILGYQINDPNIYETYNYRNEDTYAVDQLHYNLTENEIMELYPESYNLIYPLVCRACETNNEPISKAILDKMTDDIYKMVEKNQTVVNVKIGIENREQPKKENANKRTPVKFENRDSSQNRTSAKTESKELVSETRQQNNPFLRDLIKILILQKLFDGNINRLPRPNPPRPPYPPVRPQFPGARLPIGTGMNRTAIDICEHL